MGGQSVHMEEQDSSICTGGNQEINIATKSTMNILILQYKRLL